MNREIKFRGRDMSGHWVYGLLTKKKIRNSNKLQFAIATEDCSMGNTIPVIESTIGEFTGFKDVDGKEIFEGDIFTMTHGYPKNTTFVVKYCGTASLTTPNNANYRSYTVDHFKNDCKVIGNIHDNPELLEGGKTNE